MSAVALEPRAVLELLAQTVERYLTSGQPEDLLRIEMAEAVTEAWMVLRPNEPPSWRFDVPEVPAHVTALKGRYGNVWVLAADGYWNRWSTLQGKVVAGWRPFEAILEEAPLVECPDPRRTP